MTWTKRTAPIQVGDVVQYSTDWLRNHSIHTGPLPQARGTVTALQALSPDVTLATVDWGDPEVPSKVNVRNLQRIKERNPMPSLHVKKGTHRIIRTSGEDTTVEARPTIPAVEEAISAAALTTVSLGRGIVMLVDDTGMIHGKPVNEKATALMRERFPGYPYSIHGDVVIVNDRDFGRDEERGGRW